MICYAGGVDIMFDVPEDLIHRIYEDEEARRADFSPEVLEIIDELRKYTQELTREDKDYIYEKTGFYID